LFIQLPLWKCYLYSLIQRKRLYNAINSTTYRWGFKRHEVILLWKMCFKYLEKGGQKLLKADRYDQLIDQVLGNRMVVADKAEIELANRLLIIKKINVRRLLMELKQLKEFGKEVGLKLAQMNKMSDEDLVLEIIRNVEPKVQYSKELVAWYNELDDSLFDQAEATSGASSTEQTANDSVTINDVIEVIEGYTKKTELIEILEDDDVAPLFEGFDPSAFRLHSQLKKAMIEHLQTPAEPDPEPETDDQSAEIIELINDCENEDQLVEVYSEYQSMFGDMDVPDDVDEETLQSMMLAHVNSKKSEPESEPENKSMSLKERMAAKKAADAKATETPASDKKPTNEELFDWWTPEANGFSVDNAFAEVEKLKMTDLRKFAKHIGLSIAIGKKKDEILDIVANKIAEFAEGVSESTTSGEIEITTELINDSVKAKDRDALVEMCDQLEIKLNALQKKSIAGMQKKLLEAIETDDGTPESTTVKERGKLSTKASTPSPDAQSVYSIMEELVVAGKSEDAITKAVAPIYKEKGKSIIFIKKRVHTMIEIIKIDNDIS